MLSPFKNICAPCGSELNTILPEEISTELSVKDTSLSQEEISKEEKEIVVTKTNFEIVDFMRPHNKNNFK